MASLQGEQKPPPQMKPMPFAPYFDTGTWAGARQYYRAGHVLSVTAERHALLAKGMNESGEAYRQTLGLEAPKALHRLCDAG
jgi:hypothetical protein